MVMRVDKPRYSADLMHMDGSRRMETGVSLLAVRPAPDGTGRRPSLLWLQTAE